MLPLYVVFGLLALVAFAAFVAGRWYEQAGLHVPSERAINDVIAEVYEQDRSAPGHLAPRSLREGVRNELARRGYRWAPLDLKKRLGHS